jgi:chaperonin GroEL (HSP60 family)
MFIISYFLTKVLYIWYIFDVYMVQAMINISKNVNQILNIVKAKNNLKDKSEAIEKVVLDYGKGFLEPELRPDFIEKMNKRSKESTIKVKNFKEHFGLN